MALSIFSSGASSMPAIWLCASLVARMSSSRLQLKRQRVPILRRLDQEHHQEGNDASSGVDNQLPRVAEAEDGTCHQPTPPRRRRPEGRLRAVPEIREVATARRANQPPLDCEVDEELPLYRDDDHLNLRGDLLLKPLFGAVIEEISSDQRARVDH